MAMTKKDFIALADAIRDYNTDVENEGTGEPLFTRKHLELLAGFCYQQNTQFMRSRWLGYIAGENGKNGGTIKTTKKTIPASGTKEFRKMWGEA